MRSHNAPLTPSSRLASPRHDSHKMHDDKKTAQTHTSTPPALLGASKYKAEHSTGRSEVPQHSPMLRRAVPRFVFPPERPVDVRGEDRGGVLRVRVGGCGAKLWGGVDVTEHIRPLPAALMQPYNNRNTCPGKRQA